MNDFFNSQIIRDLQNGKLPVFEVALSNQSVATMAAALFLAIAAALVVAKILNSL